MSLWKSLFGGASESSGGGKATAAVEHNGFTVRATPYKDGGEYQTAGVIEKEIAGEKKSHNFVRAERFPSIEAATEFSLIKGRQIVDQVGERMFDPPATSPPPAASP
jgi:hypothetical protein